jgi:MoxR-like ATPase
VKLSRLAKALALVRGADYVDIDTVKELFLPAVAHRVVMKDPGQSNDELLYEILNTVPVDSRRRMAAARD